MACAGEYYELATECGITGWERVPALGLDDGFIDDLACAVIEARPRGTHTRCSNPTAFGAPCTADAAATARVRVAQALPRTEKPPVSDINEGRPVSLRVVNDLVQLRGKEEEIEYGPVRYEVRRTASYYLIACAITELHADEYGPVRYEVRRTGSPPSGLSRLRSPSTALSHFPPPSLAIHRPRSPSAALSHRPLPSLRCGGRASRPTRSSSTGASR